MHLLSDRTQLVEHYTFSCHLLYALTFFCHHQVGFTTTCMEIMTGHGNIRFYLHRLKIIGCPECPCKHGTQMVDHLIFQCERLVNERAKLKSSVVKVGKWPVNKSELTNRHLKQLLTYINSIDLEKINQM